MYLSGILKSVLGSWPPSSPLLLHHTSSQAFPDTHTCSFSREWQGFPQPLIFPPSLFSLLFLLLWQMALTTHQLLLLPLCPGLFQRPLDVLSLLSTRKPSRFGGPFTAPSAMVWKSSFQSGLFHAQERMEAVHTGEESQQTGPTAFLPLSLL